ncbi:nitrophenyl compound nitroreductase subunit ArsF family protein, partial [Bacteroidota bacterium]
CVTCNAVEAETKLALENFYSEELGKGEITFTSLNLDEDQSRGVAEDLKVSGQTLLLVRGDEQINLTGEGFMNARTNPTKFHGILKAQIDKLL